MSQAIVEPRSEVAILTRAIDPARGNWPPDAARSILAIQLPEADRDRLDELAAKAREGALGPADEVELDSYRHVGRLLELIKAKARSSLRSQERSPKESDER